MRAFYVVAACLMLLTLTSAQEDKHYPVSDCFMPKLKGLCRGQITRYYYNATMKRCEAFIYGGCLGNANNFVSLTYCEDVCDGVSEACFMPKREGPCTGRHLRYYYNATKKRCEAFYYGGCTSNANNFKAMAECMYFCRGVSKG